jgi:hypothetical protein
MAITAEPLSPSGLPLAADWAAISIAAASETTVTTATVVASPATAMAIINGNDHSCDGHDVDDSLHDGYEDVIVNNGPPPLMFLFKDNKGHAFLTRHAPSNADAQSPEWQCHQGPSWEEICDQQQQVL